MTVRLIPRLDIKGPNLVKGIHLEGLRVLGKPERFARLYYEEGADELLYMDAVASLYDRNSLLDIIQRTAREIFIPLTVGGGLRSIEDIRTVLRSGADKVSLNTAAISDPAFVAEAARRFGSSTIVVSIEAVQVEKGKYECSIDAGREPTGVDAYEWAQRAVELGAGEILVTSVDREGTGSGIDLELTARIAQSVGVPVVACGGVGNAGHVTAAVIEGGADAVAVASLLHYGVLSEVGSSDEDFAAEGNIEFISQHRAHSLVEPSSVSEVKSRLLAAGITCRTPTSPR